MDQLIDKFYEAVEFVLIPIAKEVAISNLYRGYQGQMIIQISRNIERCVRNLLQNVR